MHMCIEAHLSLKFKMKSSSFQNLGKFIFEEYLSDDNAHVGARSSPLGDKKCLKWEQGLFFVCQLAVFKFSFHMTYF